MTKKQAYVRGCLRILRSQALAGCDHDLVKHCDQAEAGDQDWVAYCLTVYEMTNPEAVAQ